MVTPFQLKEEHCVIIFTMFRRWLFSHASIAVAFSDLKNLNMLIAGTQGPPAGDLAGTNFVLFLAKFESYFMWKDLSIFSYDKYRIEIHSVFLSGGLIKHCNRRPALYITWLRKPESFDAGPGRSIHRLYRGTNLENLQRSM